MYKVFIYIHVVNLYHTGIGDLNPHVTGAAGQTLTPGLMV
jgi:hypothetical protein